MAMMDRLAVLITAEDGTAGAEIALFCGLAMLAGVGFICFSAGQLQQAVAGSAPTRF